MIPTLYRHGATNGLVLPLCATFFAFILGSMAVAQTSSDVCGTNAANKFIVDAPCKAFNKPTTYNATYNPGGCNAANRDDAYGWFKATGPQTTVQFTPSGNTDAILHVLATCGGASLGCSDVAGNNGTETVTIATVPGTNYFVRVQRYNSNAAMNGTLCIYNTSCLYSLTLLDSYGDGWVDFFGTAFAEIFVNNISLGQWTLNTGYSGTITFGVKDGDLVQVVYDDGFSLFYEENSMDLSVGGQCIYHTYAPPNLYLPYTVTADCDPPSAAQPQDCAGGTTLCSNADIESGSTHTGCTVDLTPTNMGCLLNGERQGTWYYFSPSTSGTLGFTITPNGNIDYDFALWGPYAATQCPNAAPARCSYADGLHTPTYLTGMGNGAVDTSEDLNGNGWVAPMNVTAGNVYVLYVDNFSASGQDFTLSWSLGGAVLDCTVLPVELLELTATARGPVIDVDWATATEHNSDHFTVQRSLDNLTFEAIGQVAAAGDANQRNDYRFTDTRPAPGINYYRLLQVDRNGVSELSQVVAARMDAGANGPFIYPNPAADVLNLQWPNGVDGMRLLIRDAMGRTVWSGAPLASIAGTWQVPVDQLAAGCYAFSINLPNGTGVEAGMFVKR